MSDWMGKTTKGTLAAALLPVLVGLFVGRVEPAAAQHQPGTESAVERLMDMSGQEFEIDFMSMMIEHHQGAISMAELAADRAMHQELKDMAQNIIRDQTREVNELTAWLQQWYNTAPKTGLMYDEMAMEAMMAMRDMTGDAFDREFLIQMHMHHREAIDMAGLVPDRATHEELKTLAQNIINSQEPEVLQLMDWAMAWYSLDLMADMEGGAPVGMPRTGISTPAALLAILLVGVSALTIAGGAWVRRRA